VGKIIREDRKSHSDGANIFLKSAQRIFQNDNEKIFSVFSAPFVVKYFFKVILHLCVSARAVLFFPAH
jgi:tRNA(His) 5'-end guanylyltransferase